MRNIDIYDSLKVRMLYLDNSLIINRWATLTNQVNIELVVIFFLAVYPRLTMGSLSVVEKI